MNAKYSFYTSKELKPAGWIKQQLEIQAKGLSGNLDKVWPHVRDSAWTGGEVKGWERTPYWLDGFIPLAYLLEDKDMIARAKKFIDTIISNQKPDGWICPCEDSEIATYDTWPIQLISKVFVVYYECSGDERIPGVVYKVLKNYYDLLSKGTKSLFRWDKARWFETFIALNWLYGLYKESWIKELAKILKTQGEDYFLHVEKWKTPINRWTINTHIVNLCMMLKFECVSCDLLDDQYQNHAKKLQNVLEKYNGTAVGTFTGDECLGGKSPIRGTELCGVVEQMFSYELLYAYTGDHVWVEKLEALAFNALPATFLDDMWTHQYDQQCNQISCEKFPYTNVFGTNSGGAHLFGLQPHFGCCTANFNQGWPKFFLSTFMHNEKEIVNSIPLACQLNTKINDTDVSIKVEGDYPFRNKITYHVKASKKTKFCLKVRVPSFVKRIIINGQSLNKKPMLVFNKYWLDEKLEIEYIFEAPRLTKRPNDMYVAKYGPLFFSLPISFTKKMLEYFGDGVERKFPYCDYELSPTSEWNYAFAKNTFEVEECEGDEYPFSSQNPRIVLKAKMAPIDWGFEEYFDNVCARKPKSRISQGNVEEKTLYPYGCSKLRVTEIPILKKKKK